MATKFLKIKSSGSLSTKELDCAMLRFENSTRTLNNASTPSTINTAAKFKTHLFVLDLGGADVAGNNVICFNFGTADRADAATNAQLFTGASNKTIHHVDVSATITNTTVPVAILNALKSALDAELVRLNELNIKTSIHAATNDRKLMVWNSKQSGVDADRPKWLVVSTDGDTPNLANNALVTTTGGSGTLASHIETEQFDESAPTGGATYYLNANKTIAGYGVGVKDQFTAADDATGTWYSDKENNVVYVKCDTTFIIQNGGEDGDVDEVFAEQCVRQVNSLRTFQHVVTAKNADKSVNGVTIADTNNPQDSKFFDSLKDDGLFPGGSTGFPTDLRDDFLGNRDKEALNTLTPALVNAGTTTNAATGETAHIANQANLSFSKTSKAITELAIGIKGGQNHILTY